MILRYEIFCNFVCICETLRAIYRGENCFGINQTGKEHFFIFILIFFKSEQKEVPQSSERE